MHAKPPRKILSLPAKPQSVHGRYATESEMLRALSDVSKAARRYLQCDADWTDYEQDFLGSLAQRPRDWPLTGKQEAVLKRIVGVYVKETGGRHAR